MSFYSQWSLQAPSSLTPQHYIGTSGKYQPTTDPSSITCFSLQPQILSNIGIYSQPTQPPQHTSSLFPSSSVFMQPMSIQIPTNQYFGTFPYIQGHNHLGFPKFQDGLQQTLQLQSLQDQQYFPDQRVIFNQPYQHLSLQPQQLIPSSQFFMSSFNNEYGNATSAQARYDNNSLGFQQQMNILGNGQNEQHQINLSPNCEQLQRLQYQTIPTLSHVNVSSSIKSLERQLSEVESQQQNDETSRKQTQTATVQLRPFEEQCSNDESNLEKYIDAGGCEDENEEGQDGKERKVAEKVEAAIRVRTSLKMEVLLSEKEIVVLKKLHSIQIQNSFKNICKGFINHVNEVKEHIYVYENSRQSQQRRGGVQVTNAAAEAEAREASHKTISSASLLRVRRVESPKSAERRSFIQRFNKFIRSKRHNNASIKLLLTNPLYSCVLRDFILSHSSEWLNKSSFQNTCDIETLLQYFLLCCEKPTLLMFLSKKDDRYILLA